MMLPTGFETFDFSEGEPYISITNNGVLFNKATVCKLGKPEWVRVLINREIKELAVVVATEDVPKAVNFYHPNSRGTMSVRLSAKDFVKEIERIMKWDLDKVTYRAPGIMLERNQTVLFELHKAIPRV